MSIAKSSAVAVAPLGMSVDAAEGNDAGGVMRAEASVEDVGEGAGEVPRPGELIPRLQETEGSEFVNEFESIFFSVPRASS